MLCCLHASRYQHENSQYRNFSSSLPATGQAGFSLPHSLSGNQADLRGMPAGRCRSPAGCRHESSVPDCPLHPLAGY